MPAASPALAIRNAEWVRLHVLEGLSYDQIAAKTGEHRQTIASALSLPASRKLKAKYLAQIEDDILAGAMHNLKEGIADKCALRRKIGKKLSLHEEAAELPENYTWDARVLLETDKRLDDQLHRIKTLKLAQEANERAQALHEIDLATKRYELEAIELERSRSAEGAYQAKTFPNVIVERLENPNRAVSESEIAEEEDEVVTPAIPWQMLQNQGDGEKPASQEGATEALEG